MDIYRQTNLSEIRAARARLITEGLLNSHIPESLINVEIEQSWRRSIAHGVNPSDVPRLLSGFQLDATLLSTANRVLDQWAESLAGSHLTLVLADKEGRIVARRTTDARHAKNLDHVNAVEGSDFSEKSLGTNGLGTAIEGKSTVFVRGPEHFNEALESICCSGAPILHPLTGRTIGSLSIAAPLDSSAELITAMTRQAVRQISDQVEHATESRDLDLARAYRRLKNSRRPMLVLNSETVMSDLPAISHLSQEFHAVLWEELRDRSWNDNAVEISLPLIQPNVTVRRIRGSQHDPIFAIEFPEPSRNRPSVNLATSTFNAAPTPIIGGYSDIRDKLTIAATRPGLIHLTGPTGVGKRFQATRWFRQQTGKEPVVFKIQDSEGEGLSRAGVTQALQEGRGVIISLNTELSGRIMGGLSELASLSDNRGRIIMTAPQAKSTGNSVDMPPLHQIPTSIPAIASALSAEIYPGSPEPKFSPSVLNRLMAWPWRGNVTELRAVIADIPQIQDGELIQLWHLPTILQQNQHSTVGSIEKAERDAIVRALQEAHGNKARAAIILGIGRSTLYRKIRELKINTFEEAV